MNKIKNIAIAAIALGTLSCAREVPFDLTKGSDGYGRVLTSSLTVKLKEAEQSRADNSSTDVGEFMVKFYNTTDPEKTVETFQYKEMPEVVVLPANVTYKIVAFHGENPSSGWDTPYYYGESAEFTVEPDKIVDNLDPVVCSLGNVKVTINFDEELANAMGEKSKVIVRVGESMLTFYKIETRSGYFEYIDGSRSLTATFDGEIGEEEVFETKAYDNVTPGTHYNITFRLHTPNASGSGGVSVGGDGGDDETKGIKVDANVKIDPIGGDNGIDITPGDEIILDDQTERPSEGGDEPTPPDDPKNPDDPNNPDQPGEGPTVTGIMPKDDAGNDKGTSIVQFNTPNEIVDGLTCAFVVKSEAAGGIKSFTIKIDSETLTPGELEGVGLAANLDLVSPGEFEEALAGLGFPVNVGGMAEAKFDITEFLGLLKVLGSGTSKFILTISDANGTSVEELILVVK